MHCIQKHQIQCFIKRESIDQLNSIQYLAPTQNLNQCTNDISLIIQPQLSKIRTRIQITQQKSTNRLIIEFIRTPKLLVQTPQFKTTAVQQFCLRILMPKTQKLAHLLPNKSYSVEGALKFVHQSQDFITAVIQQESVQRKIKIPASENQLQQGKFYRFKNCFYNSNDWLMVRKPEQSIQVIKPQENMEQALFALTLIEIKENFDELSTKYFTTFLKVYAIEPKQVLKKEGKDIQYQVIKAYSNQCLIDVTIWNGEASVDHILDQWVLFEGVRTKKMTEQKFVLVSTVFTRVSIYEWEINDWFNPERISSYQNLSQIYQKRSLIELQNMEIPETKLFSVIKAKVKSIVSADYEGCPKCRRKISARCQNCGITTKAKYSYGKVTLEEGEGSLEVIVFEQKITELFQFAKENVMIQGKVKTFGRVEEGQDVISHILTKVDSIFF